MAGSKPKFYNTNEEEAFGLFKDGKVPLKKVEDILQNPVNEENTKNIEALYKTTNKNATILGQYGRTSTRASKVAKVPKPITPTNPPRASSKKSEATKADANVVLAPLAIIGQLLILQGPSTIVAFAPPKTKK